MVRQLYDKEYRSKDVYKIKHRLDAQKHRQKYPEKVKARIAGQVFPRKPCEVCGNEQSEAHHDDYSKPWEIRWLCQKHHKEVGCGHVS